MDAWIEPFFGSGTNNPSRQNADARRTLESWATGVEIYLTRIHYRGLGLSAYEYNVIAGLPINSANYQFRLIDNPNFKNTRYYTSAVWDMVDDFNQSLVYDNSPVDKVKGFRMSNIESALKDAKSWNQFRDNNIRLSGQAAGVTELFANWNGL